MATTPPACHCQAPEQLCCAGIIIPTGHLSGNNIRPVLARGTIRHSRISVRTNLRGLRVRPSWLGIICKSCCCCACCCGGLRAGFLAGFLNSRRRVARRHDVISAAATTSHPPAAASHSPYCNIAILHNTKKVGRQELTAGERASDDRLAGGRLALNQRVKENP